MWSQKVARSGGVARGDRGAQTAHHRPDAGAVGAVDLGALKRLRCALQNGLFLLLNFGSLSLGHLLLLVRIAQTSNVKRGSRLCQTSSKVGSVLIWNYPRCFSVGWALIELWAALSVTTRTSASDCDAWQKKAAIAADKFETEG